MLRLVIPSALAHPSTGRKDPVRYCTRRDIGWLFRRRVELGLDFIWEDAPPGFMLEVGYGAELVRYNVAALHGAYGHEPVRSLGRRQYN